MALFLFSNILLHSRSFKVANIEYLIIETYSVRICKVNFILHKIKMVKTKKSLIFLKSENILINIKDKNRFHVFKGGLL